MTIAGEQLLLTVIEILLGERTVHCAHSTGTGVSVSQQEDTHTHHGVGKQSPDTHHVHQLGQVKQESHHCCQHTYNQSEVSINNS